jgi:hypothetical protein
VGEPPLAESNVPDTAPPTDIDGTNESGVTGGSMLLVLMLLVGIAGTVLAFAPARMRKR